ncbi:MAG: hypothetical protein ACRD10_06915 [Terriglobia bacterium]
MTEIQRAIQRSAVPFAVSTLWPAGQKGAHALFGRTVQRLLPPSKLKVLLLGIYRHKNAAIVATHLDEIKSQGWEVKLWALDTIHPDLEAYSVGAGKGLRMPLLNRLMKGENLASFDWVVVMDDDFVFVRGSLSSFLAIAGHAGLALAQPAHSVKSQRAFWFFTLYNPVAVARLTTFVEIGPIVAIHQDWAERILPFPEASGMGWGLDIQWSDLRRAGARLGIVDWVTLRHMQAVGRGYDNSGEDERASRLLLDRGFRSLRDLQKTQAVWRPWQRHAPWVR